MTDVRIKQFYTLEGPTFDWFVRDIGTLDDREELATAARVALGTDALASEVEILPDPDSNDRRGWWGDLDANSIWGGWSVGCKNWLLTRAKITDAVSFEGSTLERAKQYTTEALQPFIKQSMASQMDISAIQVGETSIQVTAVLYRGPLEEIALRFQTLWEEPDIINDYVTVPKINTLRRIPFTNIALTPTAPIVAQTHNVVIPSQGNVVTSPTAPTRSP